MSDRTVSRRHFLVSLGFATGGLALTAGCNGERPASQPDDDLVEQPPPVGDPLDTLPAADVPSPDDALVEQPPPVGGPPDAPPAADAPSPPAADAPSPDVVAAECPGYDALTSDQRSVRQGLQYADRSPEAGQFCRNCDFARREARYEPCMGCTILAGPVAPQGWCAAWAPTAS